MSRAFTIRTIGLGSTYDIIILKQKFRGWFRSMKVKYFHKHGGPREPSKETDLYFDWRRMREPDNQTSGNAHPGDERIIRQASGLAMKMRMNPEDFGSRGVKTPSVQPTGQYLVVICRISGWSSARKFTAGGLTVARSQAKVIADLVAGGLTMGDRLAANCPTPKNFLQIKATAHHRLGGDFTNFQKAGNDAPAMVKDIRAIFNSFPEGAAVTALIRSIDGISIDATLQLIC
ncbi:hypothetical protein P153DRAFT_387433 [Dothidotthia symphoricarpi CBS 119687]|uniref:Uncharacterized protein n=1 Tax=Dothidotthia symphoricarpi CBS 119687 TaxID=1392245 RepID=A0A6A6AAI4_9PLEO|nr:uncharacterized protein P153DRAFT_387433 [Dothidotthia symphoricarpi CBS 119687]KAF2127701.1 hypothetical protein P153DRAFT_387433 [Dothidotthia symphoricarpi CBS 119687]